MAFHFNWSPLIADTSRARDMLTSALNKSPKPPIIVDDIIVTELNLGTTPPALEILEIGDLAEDRFRGIFKMSYRGDAFLTLKTRVQANPLNTYLSTKPSFVSPQPLAAASGLTIPLAITLSDIQLSGFVILVFSRQKGLTIVFRNDPLESLKVSSTFDSIPFVRDYLQKEIEGQLRVLFMEDLPAILHRLSLRMFCPEYSEPEIREETLERLEHHGHDGPTVDAFAREHIDFAHGDSETPNFAFDFGNHTTFSQKNLQRLGILSEAHRTLSLSTPAIGDSVFRAWAGAATGEYATGSDVHHAPSLAPSLSRLNSFAGGPQSVPSVSSLSVASDGEVVSSRPSLVSFPSSSYGLSMATGSGRSRGTDARKRKKRVINLRKKDTADTASITGESASSTTPSSPEKNVYPASAPSVVMDETRSQHEGDLVTPPRSPNVRVRFTSRDDMDVDATPRLSLKQSPLKSPNRTPRQGPKTTSQEVPPLYDDRGQPITINPTHHTADSSTSSSTAPLQPAPILRHSKSYTYTNLQPIPSTFYSNYASKSPLLRSFSNTSITSGSAASSSEPEFYNPFAGSSGGILEQAWMNKIAAEIARKVREEKNRPAYRGRNGSGRGDEAPPAYVS